MYDMIRTPLGWMGAVESPKGIVALYWGRKNRGTLLRRLQKRYPGIHPKEGKWTRKTKAFLEAYFRGKVVSLPPIDLSSATPFQRRVLRRVLRVPYGHVQTYGWLSGQLSRPNAARACGQALRRNRLPVLIPCHRIVPAKGREGGFAWGKKAKAELLRHEGIRVRNGKGENG